MSAEVIGLKRNTVPNVISAFTVTAARTMKMNICKWARSRWLVLFAIVAGAVLAVVAIKLIALFATALDVSFLRNTGTETGNGAGMGAGGAGLGGGATGGAGGGDGGGGGGGPAGPPWWQKWVPSSWTNITVGPVSIDTKTGHVSFGPVDVGVSPGGASGGIVDIGVNTPVGTQPVATVGINQQNVPLTGMGSTTPSGRQILNATMSSDGTYNNIGN
jgi:hypothetical protein